MLNLQRKERIFDVMESIEAHTGGMLHEIDNQRFVKILDAMAVNKLAYATNEITKWFDEVNN